MGASCSLFRRALVRNTKPMIWKLCAQLTTLRLYRPHHIHRDCACGQRKGDCYLDAGGRFEISLDKTGKTNKTVFHQKLRAITEVNPFHNQGINGDEDCMKGQHERIPFSRSEEVREGVNATR